MFRRGLPLVFLICGSQALAAKIAEFRLENNANDSVGGYHGTLVSGGPSFVLTTPLPIQGSYSIKTTAGYVSLPVSVLADVGLTGTIKYLFFTGDTDTWINKVSFSWLTAGDNGFIQILSDATFRIKYTTTGAAQTSTSTAVFRRGRWYQVSVRYTSANLSVDVHDFIENTDTTFISDSGTNPRLNAATEIRLGTYVAAGGFEANYAIDNFKFYTDSNNTVDFTAGAHRNISAFGDSIMAGAVIGGTCGNAYGLRGGMTTYWQANSFNTYPYGTVANSGTVFVNGHNAVAGQKLSDLQASVSVTFAANYSAYNANEGAVIFLGTNDAAVTVAYSDAVSWVASIATKIHAFNPSIKVFFCTALERTDGFSVTVVNNGIRDGVAQSGANTYLIDTHGVAGVVLCSDGLHPNTASLDLLGVYIATRIQCTYQGTCGLVAGSMNLLGVGK